MTALVSYSTGTVTISAGGTTVTGTGTIWSGVNARPGDVFQVGNFQSVISDVVDTGTLTIPPWGGGAQTGVAYKIWQVSPQRFAGAQAMATVNELVAALNASGFFWFVGVDLTVPDPSLGNDGQYAYQPSTGSYWLKTGGAWVPTGSPAAGYGGTSTTSLAVGTGSKAFTTQAGLAYNGARVRATAASDVTKWMEGPATYSGSTLTIAADKSNGSGTLASWTFAIAGQPGTGDVNSANNGSDFANVDTTLSNLHGVSYGVAQTLTTAQRSHARANIGVTKKNYVLNGGMQVSQENGTTTGTTDGYYPADMWFVRHSLSGGTFTVGQVAVATPGGSTHRLRLTVTAAQATVGSSAVYLAQKIEGLRVADLFAGTASAKTVTLQIGIKAPVVGTYQCVLSNASVASSIAGTFTIASGEVGLDVVKSVTLALPTSGTWATDNTAGLVVYVYQMTSSQTANVFATNGNVFELFDVGLYEGATAPAYQPADFGSELALCQRYYEKSYNLSVSPGTASSIPGLNAICVSSNSIANGQSLGSRLFQTRKRAAPTMTVYGYQGGAGKVSDASPTDLAAGSGSTSLVGEAGFNVTNASGGTVTTTNTVVTFHWVANARL